MKNTKGLSTIVATLIIILLVLVAVGIIWVVVRNVIEGGASQIQGSNDCLSVEVRPTKALCSPNTPADGGNNGECNVTYERSEGGDDIGGVKLVLENSDGDTNFIWDVPNTGQINPLSTNTETLIPTGITNVSHVEARVYFLDESGNEILCATSGEYDF